MRSFLTLGLAAALAMPGVALAQDAAPEPASKSSERRLSPEQIDAVLAAAAARREAAGVADQQAPSAVRPIQGEVGFSIGTGGYRGIFGSTSVPLGEDGLAAFGFDIEDFGHRRIRH